ncbi:MAG: DUF4386 domain-containing protein [Sciscionella sp.]
MIDSPDAPATPAPARLTSRRPSAERHGGPQQGGPPLLAPALAFAVLTIAGLVLGIGIPRPSATPAQVLAYDLGHPMLLRVLALLVFGSSIPLAVLAATTYQRLRRLGVTAPGSVMALSGGLLAAATLALSGLCTWTVAEVAGPSGGLIVRALTTLGFAAGGPGFVVPLALFLAGVAVPGLIIGLLPRPLAWIGLVLAGLGMLATLSLLTPALYPLLPIGRFGGLLWLVAVATVLPTNRHRRTPAPASS